MMLEHMGPERTCPHCQTRSMWNGRAFLVVDQQGRLEVRGHPTSGEAGPEPEIKRCPNCRKLLGGPEGKARVEEVK